MANNERIDEIISEKAFEQLDTLLQKLNKAQDGFSLVATSVIKANDAINKTQSIKEYNKQVQQANKIFRDLAKEEEKVANSRKKANQVEKEIIDTSTAKVLSMEQETALLENLTGGVEQNVRSNIQFKTELKSVREAMKELDSEMSKSERSSQAQIDKKQALAERENQLQQAITKSNLELRRATKEGQAAEGSYDQLTLRLDRLRGSYRTLSEEERNNADVGGALLKSIEENDKKLKELDATMGIYNRNVGNYTGGIEEAVKETGLFGKELQALAKFKSLYSGATKIATVSTASFSKVLMATGIGAVLILIGSLITFLTTTQRGMDFLSRSVAGVTTFFVVFRDALANLGEEIADNIIPLFRGLGDIIKGIATLNFDTLKNGLDGVKDSLNNINGLNLIEITAEAAKAGKEAARLEGVMQRLKVAEAQLNVERSNSQAKINELRELSQDESKTLQERQKATRELSAIEENLTNKSIALLEQKLNAQKEINSLTISTEADLQKERDLEIEINNVRAKSASDRRRFQREAQALNAKANQEAQQRIKEQEEATKRSNDARIDLEVSRIDRVIERNKTVVDDEKLAYEDRISNLEQFITNQEQKLILEKEKALSVKGLLKDQITKIEEETQEKLEEIRRNGTVLNEKIIMDQLKGEEKLRAETLKQELNAIQTREAEKLTELNKAFQENLISEEEFQQSKIDIQRQFTRDYINREIRGVEEIIEANRKKGVDVSEEEKKLAELKKKLSEETTNKILEDLKEVEKAEKELQALQMELRKELGNLAVSLVAGRFAKEEEALKKQEENSTERQKREIERINSTVVNQEEKAIRIMNAEKNAEREKEKIENRRRTLMTRQARFEKAVAMSSIIAKTAQAIITQLASAPLFPISGPLIPIIAGIGALQLATVASAPIPAFAKGTKYSPEGIALVGEEGTELIIDPSGEARLTGDTAELTHLNKGSQVIPHKDVVKMMEKDRTLESREFVNQAVDFSTLIEEQKRGTGALKKAIGKKVEKNTIIGKNGMTYIYKNGAETTKYINKLL